VQGIFKKVDTLLIFIAQTIHL